MIDKLSIIKQILETDEETDRKILSIIELAKENPDKKNIHRIEERVISDASVETKGRMISRGDVVLIKGSRVIGMERIIERIRA